MCKELFCSLLVLGIVLTSGAHADISEGLIGWWMFDEGTGTTVADSSGNGHDGFFVDGTPEWVTGMYGKALKFDGENKVEIPDHEDFHLTNAITVALWAQPENDQPDYAKFFCKQKLGEYPYGLQYSSSLSIRATVNASARYDTSTIPNFPGEWAHLSFTYDGSAVILYKDGEEVARRDGSGDLQQNDLSLSIGGRLNSGQNFIGIIDDVRLYNRALTAEEIKQIMVDVPPPAVTDPSPVDGAEDVPQDVVLSWIPVEVTTQHDIYLGTDAQAVADADTSDATGIYRGRQIAGSYIPAEMLVFGETYYWRVDEIGDNIVLEGNLWSFTVELFAYPVTDVAATASSNEPGKEAENVVNGSGLDDSGLLHAIGSVGNMWLSARDGNQPTWIEFEFDGVHKLHEMWVWNSNDSLEQVVGLGFKDVIIEYSADGIEFITLGTTHEFTQALGAADYEHDTTIDMEGVAAKYVRLTANSNWGNIFQQFGLSEVRFFSIPVSARGPSPASGATDVALDLTLEWTAGRGADRHDVYFSDDVQAVIDSTAPVTALAETSRGPLSLNVGTTYYWRVDEVNDAETPAVWPGVVWDFTTVDSLVVDDFESYNAEENQIWYAWKDGLGYGVPEMPPYYAGNGTGAAVGDENTDSFTEETIVHGGNQSMPLAYDNNKQGYLNYSETTLTLNSQRDLGPRDWTQRGVKELSIWFRGNPASVGGFAEGPAGTYTMTAAGADIWDTSDEFHYAFKMLTGPGTITASLESLENTHGFAKAGLMVRSTLGPESANAALLLTPANGVRFQYRSSDGGATDRDFVSDLVAPLWLKLERDVAGNFRGYYSSDGINFEALDLRVNVSMDSTVYIGLALTSHDAALTCQAVFSGVQTTGTVTGQWQSQDIGILSNSAESMYVAVSDSAGVPAIVYHDDPAATQIDTWTEWVVDLNQLADQGVNLADVDNISIGLGNRDNPQPGGSGKMYFDDIRLYGSRSTE
jgi:hypothetical protein